MYEHLLGKRFYRGGAGWGTITEVKQHLDDGPWICSVNYDDYITGGLVFAKAIEAMPSVESRDTLQGIDLYRLRSPGCKQEFHTYLQSEALVPSHLRSSHS